MFNVSLTQKNTGFKTNFHSKVNFRGTEPVVQKNNSDKFISNQLPEDKAVLIKRKVGVARLLLNIVTIPLGFFGFSTMPDFELIDIDVNNLTKEQERLIKKGKIINYIPVGYHIENGKIVKN